MKQEGTIIYNLLVLIIYLSSIYTSYYHFDILSTLHLLLRNFDFFFFLSLSLKSDMLNSL